MSAPHDLGPWDDLLQLASLDEVRAALQRHLPARVAGGEEPPSWIRWLGPWLPMGLGDRYWDRSYCNARGAVVYGARVHMGPRGWEAINLRRNGHQGPYALRSEAMAAADATAVAEGWLLLPSIPAEEDRPPRPLEPLPPVDLPPVPRVNHYWRVEPGSGVDTYLERCSQCGRWRWNQRRYLPAGGTPEEARILFEAQRGETRAQRCAGGRR